jgi:class 3 adenylate cyclase/tetratricopeptide (TPR) repeat protein
LACPRCGEPVVGPERKLVTVLFADLSGYTAFAASLDPEEVFAVVRPWMTALRLVVERHGGTVPQVMGDGFMAVFGVPAAHDDDAERAVRAGLALVSEARALDADAAQVRFPGLHVGVNTGEVMVVGSREASGFALVGDPVNVAARLADLAVSGEILVGEATRALTTRSIRYATRRLRSAKGLPQPIATYRPIGIREDDAPLTTGPRRGVFMDRVAVLRRVTAEADAAARSGRARVRAIVDEPGVGKSRLAAELRARLPDRLVLVGACHPYGQRLPLGAIADAVAAELGIRRGVAPKRLHEVVRRSLRSIEAGGSPALLGHLEALLGLTRVPIGETAEHGLGPGGPPVDARAAVRPVIRALARGRSVIVVLDDVHLADADLLALLSDIRRSPWPDPVLFLALGRPESGAWCRGLPRIRLGALPAGEARRVVVDVLGGPAPAGVVDRILERGGGNPLFLEESARMLVESGALVRTPSGWLVSDPSAVDQVPPSLRLLVAARLDALPAVEKRTLQDASITGEVTWDALLRHLASATRPPEDRAAVDAAVGGLVARDLLSPCPVSRIADAIELQSKHAVIRDVAYDSLPMADRAGRHRLVADWLRAHGGEAATAAIAHHYERAWDLGRSRTRPFADPALARLAARYLGRRGDAVFSFQPRLAEASYERGLQIARAEPDAVEPALFAHLLVGRAEGLGELGRQQEAIESAEQALLLLGDEDADRGRALLTIGRARADRGEVGDARTLIGQALALFTASGDTLGQARATHLLGEAWRFDDFATEIDCYHRAFRLYRAGGARVEAALVAEELAYLMTVVGGRDFRRWFDRARRLVEEIGDERSRAALSRTWAYAAWYRGELDEALRAAREARGPAADAGDRWLEVDTLLLEAQIRSAAGPPDEADRLVLQLLRIADAVGARHLRAVAQLAGARPALRTGHPVRATRRLAGARRGLVALGVAMELAEVDLVDAGLQLDRGRWEHVPGPATAAEGRARSNGWDLLVPVGPLLRGRAHLGAGRLGPARTELARAARLAAALDAVGPLALARASLEQAEALDGGRPPAAPADTVPRSASPASRPFAPASLAPTSRRQETAGLALVEIAAIDAETAGLSLLRDDPRAATTAFGLAVRAWNSLGMTVWGARAEAFRAVALDATGRASAASAARRRSRAILEAVDAPASTRSVIAAWTPGPG